MNSAILSEILRMEGEDSMSELQILNGILNNRFTVDDCINGGLKTEWFTSKTYLMVYLLIMEVSTGEVDFMSVFKASLAKGMDRALLYEIQAFFHGLPDLASLIEEVRVNHKSKEIISKAYEIYENKLPYKESIEIINGIVDSDEVSEETTSDGKGMVAASFERMKQHMNGTLDRGYSYGFPNLEKLIGKFRENLYVVIAARPSMGKTALMMNFIDEVCVKQKVPTLVFSMEMTTDQLTNRLVGSICGVNIQKFYDSPKDGDLKKIKNAYEQIADSPIYTDDNPTLTINQLKAKVKTYVRKHGIKVVALDYLQLMRGEGKSREQDVAGFSSTLKSLAKELKLTMIVLCQLNRESSSRKGGRPKMSDLRESGSLEQDADVIIFPDRKAYHAEDEEQKAAYGDAGAIIVDKCREGETGYVHVTFDGEATKFKES